MESERAWTAEMGEISGFGGTYEDGCRTMVLAGLDWLDGHPTADPKFHGFTDVYGVLVDDNDDAKALSKAMVDAADAKYPDGGVTGAMHQACVQHVLFVRKHGWDRYVADLKAREKKGGP